MRQWKKKNPNKITLFSLALAALKNPQNPLSKTLILKCSNQFLHHLHPKSPVPSSSSAESFLNHIVALLPPLLHSSFDDIVCAAAKIVGAASLVSIEVNERIACDLGIVKVLVASILRVRKMAAKKALCNAVLDLSITSFGCQRLLEVSGLNYLMLGFLQVQKSTATSMYINIVKNEGDAFLGVQHDQDPVSLLYLTAVAALTNFCTSEQLKRIPSRLKEVIFPHLGEIWSKVREQLLASKILNLSEVKFFMSNLTVQNLAENIFRLSMDSPALINSIPSEVVIGHIFGPWSSSFQNFILDNWESSPLVIRNQPKDPEAPHILFSSFMHSLTCEEALPRFLSSILRGTVSCPPVALNEIDSLNFLNDIRDTLGSPMIYQQDIRVVKTNLHSKSEEHYFQESSIGSSETSKSLSADDILKCEAAYREGYTIALRGMGFRFNSIAAVTQEIASFFGQPSVGANLYVTPPDAQGLSCHYDDHCVFVCQLYGAKQWAVFPQPAVKLPRLYECLEVPQALLVESRQILLRKGDVLYIPRGFAHQACTITDLGASSEVHEPSVHLTLAIEIEPPFEWEGFAHVALHQWSHNKGFDILALGTSKNLLAVSVNLLHIAIRLISHTEPMFRKACLVAASSLPTETEDWLDKNQRTTFDLVMDKINKLSSFTDSLKFLQMPVQRDEDPFNWLRWLEHANGREVSIMDNLGFTSDEICKILTFIYQHKDDVEGAFVLIKSKFCNEALFDDAKESFRCLHSMYKEARMRYLNGMLSLH